MESAANPSHVDLSEKEGEKTLPVDVSPEQQKVVQTEKSEVNAEHPAGEPTTREVAEHTTGPKLALITLALCLGVFLVALGTFTPLCLLNLGSSMSLGHN